MQTPHDSIGPHGHKRTASVEKAGYEKPLSFQKFSSEFSYFVQNSNSETAFKIPDQL